MHLPTDLDSAHRMILQLLKQADELQAIARIDALTGVANRRAFEDRMSAAFAHARRTSTSMSVAVLDLDNFKRRNDQHGHAAGDICLKEFAAQLVHMCRADDTVARIGGEEFALILPETDASAAVRLCQRIADRVRLVRCSGDVVTFSGGVAALDGTMVEPSTVVDYADRAMYLAKRTGKDKVCIHQPTFHRAAASGLFQRITRHLL